MSVIDLTFGWFSETSSFTGRPAGLYILTSAPNLSNILHYTLKQHYAGLMSEGLTRYIHAASAAHRVYTIHSSRHSPCKFTGKQLRVGGRSQGTV